MLTDFERQTIACAREEHPEDALLLELFAIIERLQSPRVVCEAFEKLMRERGVTAVRFLRDDAISIDCGSMYVGSDDAALADAYDALSKVKQ